MTFDYQVDAAGLRSFLSSARGYVDDIRNAGPGGTASLSGLSDEATALSDPDLSRVLTGLFSDRESDLTAAADAIDGVINAVERAGDTLVTTDDSMSTVFTSHGTGPFSPARFSSGM